jgi:hypothetical protein
MNTDTIKYMFFLTIPNTDLDILACVTDAVTWFCGEHDI